jgi:hypothetical protein
VARTRERLVELKRAASTALSFGVKVEVITPSEAGRRCLSSSLGRNSSARQQRDTARPTRREPEHVAFGGGRSDSF